MRTLILVFVLLAIVAACVAMMPEAAQANIPWQFFGIEGCDDIHTWAQLWECFRSLVTSMGPGWTIGAPA